MRGRRMFARIALVVVLGFALFAAQGCTYLKHRGQDFLDTFDLGISLSIKPCLGLYANGVSIACLGYSEIDGWVVGWAGGTMGIVRHYNKCWGAGLVGYEEIGWGDFDKNDPSTLYRQGQGLLGVLLYKGNPSYVPACVHFFPHLGWVGLVWNARYMEMIDFVVGFTTLDLAGDDGVAMSSWPWQRL